MTKIPKPRRISSRKDRQIISKYDPIEVVPNDDFTLTVKFKAGEFRRINIKTLLVSDDPIKHSLSLFQQAFIEDGAVISWPGERVSIDPELIYLFGEVVLQFKE